MDSLKQVPQAFFDAIARIVPGAIAILVILEVTPGVSLKTAVDWISVSKLSDSNVFGFVSLSLVFFGYAAGHLVSTIGKAIGELPIYGDVAEDWREYDWLRANRPDLCNAAIRVRAEYTMHFSFAGVFALGFFVGALANALSTEPVSPVILIIFLLLTPLSAYRGHKLKETFWLSVASLAAAAREQVA